MGRVSMGKSINEQKDDFNWKDDDYISPTKVCFHRTMTDTAWRNVPK